MDCREVEELLSPYLDRELDDESMAEVDEHLKTCSECRQKLEFFAGVKAAARSLPDKDVPADLHAKVMDSVKAARLSIKPKMRFAFRTPWAYAAAAILLVIAFSFVSTLAGRYLPGKSGTTAIRSGQENIVSSGTKASTDEARQVSPQISTPSVKGTEGGSVVTKDYAGSYDMSSAAVAVDRKIVKNAYLSLAVARGKVQQAAEEAARIAQASGGYVEHSSMSQGSKTPKQITSASLTIRVPSNVLDKLLSDFAQLGSVTRQETSATDVTEQYIDVSARLRNKQAQEARLVELLGKANTIGEVMQVEGELARVRSEIEYLTGQMRYMEKTTTYASVSLSIVEEGSTVPSAPSFWTDVWNAFLLAWRKLFVFLAGVMPAAIVIVLATLAYVKIRGNTAKQG